MALPVNPGNAQVIVNASASRYDVPPQVLWGVFGIETDFGRNLKTSSAGAIGAFQFIPSTANTYDYPLTNDPSLVEFQKQADAAAHYLRDLYKQLGTWDRAVRGYNAGPDNWQNADYTLKDVLVKAKQGPGKSGGIIGALGEAGGAVRDAEKGAAGVVKDTAGAIGDLAGYVGKFFALLTSLEFWLRLGQGVAALVLLAMGLKALTGVTVPTPVGKV